MTIILMSSSVRGAENNAIFWTKKQDQQKTNGAPTPVWIGYIRTLPSPQLFPHPEPQPPQEKCDHFSLSCPAACTACYS